MEREGVQQPLHALHFDKLTIAINRSHILLHSLLVSLFLYHRLSLLLPQPQNDAVLTTPRSPPLLPCFLLFLAELLLSFLWLSEQPFRWSPVNRTAFIDRLRDDEAQLPAIDVLICTADPDKEPTVEVMNTVVSAMALDYPPGKLHVYLSDDGGAAATLSAMKEAWGFATWWLPFCNKYGVIRRCPVSYFEEDQLETKADLELITDRSQIKEKYELFKHRIEMILLHRSCEENRVDHQPILQVINESCTDPSNINPDRSDIPLLVYVAREKRPSRPHHFKAGALNVLLRVSGLLSNSPVVLMLDCDMYCNDPTSAKQAMCFFLDPEVSPSLAFVQFPQRYHNLRDNDIYDGGLRWAFKGVMQGMDGLNTGPLMCGSGLYLNRKAIYNPCIKATCNIDQVQLRNSFGPSNEFIKTTRSRDLCKPDETKRREISEKVLREAEFVASCSYEDNTKWGNGVGFYYYSIAEDVFAGYHLHIGGWKSIYIDPKRASFLGTCTTNFNVFLTQNTRWVAGLVEIGISRFFPFVYGPSRRHLSLALRMCYAWSTLYAIDFVSVWCLAVIPQLCLFHGIPIYSNVKVSIVLASLIFLSSLLKHLHEVLTTGGTFVVWWNEQRTWTMKMLTCNAYGCIDATMKIMGLKNTSFIPTNKVTDEEQAERYRQGIYDFRTSNMFLVPLGTAVVLNMVSFVGGLVRMMVVGNRSETTVLVVLSGFFIVMSKPVVEGMVVRKDEGRFPGLATLMSIGVCSVLLAVGALVLTPYALVGNIGPSNFDY